ncbi:MAG TPA: sulfite exporter TauE/SafE family protein [Gemmatimonadaceae bacterium]|nr:sulfite exporter TauE/SafE family protein [Gemmatimonadaceae bacterium]
MTLLAIALVAAVGGAVNSIAGGGTLLTFPSLIALGIPPIVANATSTVALWPGALASMWGYRRQLAGARAWAVRFAIPSLAGGLAGALLLLNTPAERFSMLVPWLVLAATLLFMAQGPLMRRLRAGRHAMDDAEAVESLAPPPVLFLIYQFVVGIYGGYFGAGVGILMLASLGMMGLVNIHRMNGLKNWGGMCMNAVAAVTFAITGIVNWPVALAMAAGAMAGGYAGARLAQRVRQRSVRKAIIAIGLLSTIWLAFGR